MSIEGTAIFITTIDSNGYNLNRLAIGIHARKGKLAEIDSQLRELNERFPGQRKLKQFNQDPEYRSAREALLDLKRSLVGKQIDNKKEARGKQRFFEQKKGSIGINRPF